jgi:hypothetical protein
MNTKAVISKYWVKRIHYCPLIEGLPPQSREDHRPLAPLNQEAILQVLPTLLNGLFTNKKAQLKAELNDV